MYRHMRLAIEIRAVILIRVDQAVAHYSDFPPFVLVAHISRETVQVPYRDLERTVSALNSQFGWYVVGA